MHSRWGIEMTEFKEWQESKREVRDRLPDDLGGLTMAELECTGALLYWEDTGFILFTDNELGDRMYTLEYDSFVRMGNDLESMERLLFDFMEA